MRAIYDGLTRLLEPLFGSGGILAYHGVGREPFLPSHHVTESTLRLHLEELSTQYTIIPLVEMVERLRRGRSIRRLLSITFDDAYVGVLRYAAPLFRELDLPATVFACAGHTRHGSRYWWDLLECVRVRGDATQLQTLSSALALPDLRGSNRDVFPRLRERILSHRCGRGPEDVYTSNLPALGSDWRSCTITELQLLAEDPRFDFGSHTNSHPVLPFLPPAEQKQEIRQGHAFLVEHLPRVRPFLAYPYGLYNHTTVRVADSCGITVGFSVEPRPPQLDDSPMQLPRMCMHEGTPTDRVSRTLATSHGRLRLLLRGRHPSLQQFHDTPAAPPHSG